MNVGVLLKLVGLYRGHIALPVQAARSLYPTVMVVAPLVARELITGLALGNQRSRSLGGCMNATYKDLPYS